jgi:phosphatidylinositol alpha-mannosyltransferase
MAKRSISIGIVCPYNMFRHGGVQETIIAHQKILKARGHRVKILTPRPLNFSDKPPEDVVLIGVSTDLNYPFKTKADISYKVGNQEIIQTLADEQFDILHFHEPWVPLFPRQVLNASQSKNVGTFHAKWPESLIYRTFGKAIKPYARSIVRDLDYLVAASEPGSHYINELIGSEVRIIFNGVDLKRFNLETTQPLRKYDDNLKTILYINRLEKRKGPDLLLAAYAELVKDLPNVRLLIGSDGDMRSKLEDYVEINELPNVEFLGFISDDEKVQLYRSADLYTAPSPYGEGFGIVLLEAMAMGVPYVAGDNPGYRYASAERADDYLIDPYDAVAYAAKMKQLLTDTKMRSDYQHWALERAKSYDYERIVDEYESIYVELLADE